MKPGELKSFQLRPTFALLCDKTGLLTAENQPHKIITEVHVGWCPPGTSNPVDLPQVDRSVRFRHTSAKLLSLRTRPCPRAGVPARCNGVHPDEPKKASKERTVSWVEGSETPGAAASRHAATNQA